MGELIDRSATLEALHRRLEHMEQRDVPSGGEAYAAGVHEGFRIAMNWVSVQEAAGKEQEDE